MLKGFRPRSFAHQTRVLVYKNVLQSMLRRPVGFFFCICGLPIAILALLLALPTFFMNNTKFGVAQPAPLSSLADVLDKTLVIVCPPHLGDDIGPLIEKFTKDLPEDRIRIEEDDAILKSICVSNLRGVSPCFGAVTFTDTPGTTKAIPENLKMTYQYDDKGNLIDDPDKVNHT